MNWLFRLAQHWTDKHPDYDLAKHLHEAFSVMFPLSDGKQWETPGQIFYSPSGNSQRYKNPANEIMTSFLFLYNQRIYTLQIVVNDQDNDPVSYIKLHGIEGNLIRSWDQDLADAQKQQGGWIVPINKDIGTIISGNPKDFIDQMVAMITSDKDDDDGGNEEEPLFPDWPYEEEPIDEDVVVPVRRR